MQITKTENTQTPKASNLLFLFKSQVKIKVISVLGSTPVWKIPRKTKVKQLGREKWIRNKLGFFCGRKQKDTFHMGRLSSTLFPDTPRENIPPNINKFSRKIKSKNGEIEVVN